MRTLVAICGLDRPELVRRMLGSLREAFAVYPGPRPRVVFHVDPNATELDDEVLGIAVDESVHLLHLRERHPRTRVAAMRVDAAAIAVAGAFERVVYLDSDVLLDPAYFVRLDELWRVAPPWGAVSLGNWIGYTTPYYYLRALPEHDASLRRRGMGASLAFRVDDALERMVKRGVKEACSWDGVFSRDVARGRVLTSDTSYVRHLGKFSGMCTTVGHYGLDFHRFTPALAAAEFC